MGVQHGKATSCAVLAMMMMGCAGRGGGLISQTTVRHPMNGGAVNPNVALVIEDEGTERAHGITPGSLRDEVALTQANAQQLCFEVTVRVPEDEQQWADMNSYLFQILSSDTESEPIENAQIAPRPVQSVVLPGERNEQIPTGGHRTYCASRDGRGNCLEVRSEPIMRTIRVPTPRTVFIGGGQVCFANQGVLSPSTTWMRMRMVDPANPRGRAGYVGRGRLGLNYEWNFAGAAAPPPESNGDQQEQASNSQATAGGEAPAQQ